MRRVFFSFKYKEDVHRTMVVRNSGAFRGITASGFADHAEFEEVKGHSDNVIRRWIDNQLHGTSVTVVLVGSHTCQSRWVKYEIDRSIQIGNGLLGIDISNIACLQTRTTSYCCGSPLPNSYPLYRWDSHDGYNNMGKWIETAARAAGR